VSASAAQVETEKLNAINAIYELVFDLDKSGPVLGNLFQVFNGEPEVEAINDAFENVAQIASGLNEKLDIDLSRDVGVVVLGLSRAKKIISAPDGAAEWIGSQYKGDSNGIGWVTKEDKTKHVAHIVNPTVLPNLAIAKSIKVKLEKGEIQTLIVVHSFEVSATAKQALNDLYKLTKTEIDVCIPLTKGKSLNEIAVERDVSRETIKTHLKNIYAKMGVKRQTSLVRLLTQIFAAAAIHSYSRKENLKLEPDWKNGLISYSTFCVNTLPGDRICYSKFGDPDGKPVVYIHHALGARWHSREMAEAAKKHRILVIKPDRPGFGHSDALPTYHPKLLAQFFEKILDHNRIKSAHFIAYGIGGRPFLESAPYFVNRITDISLWSFMGGPKTKLPSEGKITGLGVGLTQWAWKNPKILLNFLKILRYGLNDQVTSAKNLKRHYSRSEADIAALQKANVVRNLLSENKLSFQQEFKGTALDHQQALQPFSMNTDGLSHLNIKTFYGDQDVFANFESNEPTFAALHSWSHYSVKNSGQLLPSDDFDRFLDCILNFEKHQSVALISRSSAK